ncbi:MAG: hypothetical protein PF588_05825 [Candidatus Kapabacteria bacterium]|nr:hypothetical protein [Candidatus Kapabacteria bacterium]
MTKATKKNSPAVSKKETAEPIQKVTEEAPPKTEKKEVPQPNKQELELNAKKMKRRIASIQDSIVTEQRKCDEWLIEGNRLIEETEQKFESDKVKKILTLKEEASSEGKDILINFYKSEITRLESDKAEQVESGDSGEFSAEFKKFIKQRSERFEKRKLTLHRNWITWTHNRLEKKMPVFKESISKLETQLEEIEKLIAAVPETKITIKAPLTAETV